MSTQLKPCPFCGREQHEEATKNRGGMFSHFCGCGAMGPIDYPREEANKVWNQRLIDDDGTDILQNLRNQINSLQSNLWDAESSSKELAYQNTELGISLEVSQMDVNRLNEHVASLRKVCEAAFQTLQALKYADYEQVKGLVEEVEGAMQEAMEKTKS